MYSRQFYDPARQRVRVPENYSGNAFGSLRQNPMPPPARKPPPQSDIPPSAFEIEKDERDISPETGYVMPQTDEISKGEIATQNEGTDEEQSRESALETAVTSRPESKRDDRKRSDLFSSLLPAGFSFTDKFPFGHGIGSEEILILAIMLMVYLSGLEKGETDNEFILLLGLLLFAG